MKTKKSFRLLAVLLATLLLTGTLSFGLTALADDNDWVYEPCHTGYDGLTILQYNGKEKDVAVPTQLEWNGELEPVVSIDADTGGMEDQILPVFPDSIEAVTIPDSVKYVSATAFDNCTNLTSVHFGNSVQNEIPNFFNCPSLKSVTFSEDNPYHTVINGNICSKDKTTFELYLPNQTSSIFQVPEGITEIRDAAFASATNLKELYLPDSLTSFESDIVTYYYDYENVPEPPLQILHFGENIKTIDSFAFYNLKQLVTIDVPSENTYFATINGVLYNKDKSELIKYPAKHMAESFVIPDSVQNIGAYAFYNSKCTSVVLPNTIKTIDDAAFAYSGLTDIHIPDSVTEMGDFVFDNCKNLQSIRLSKNTPVIPTGTFQYCSSLQKIEIPEGVKSLGLSSIEDCSNLQKVTLPDSLTTISDGVFAECPKLKSLVIGPNVTQFGEYDDWVHGHIFIETIYGYTDSAAETFAKEHDIAFVAITNTVLSDSQTGIQISGTIPQGAAFSVKTLESTDSRTVYDISLTANGETVQPVKAVTVQIPVPNGMDGAACKVYRGETDGTYTDMHAALQNGCLTFSTEHFSRYVVTTGDPSAPETPTDPENPTQPEEPTEPQTPGEPDTTKPQKPAGPNSTAPATPVSDKNDTQQAKSAEITNVNIPDTGAAENSHMLLIVAAASILLGTALAVIILKSKKSKAR